MFLNVMAMLSAGQAVLGAVVSADAAIAIVHLRWFDVIGWRWRTVWMAVGFLGVAAACFWRVASGGPR